MQSVVYILTLLLPFVRPSNAVRFRIYFRVEILAQPGPIFPTSFSSWLEIVCSDEIQIPRGDSKIDIYADLPRSFAARRSGVTSAANVLKETEVRL